MMKHPKDLKKPKKARVEKIVACYLQFPHCRAEMEAPNGSLIWFGDDLDSFSNGMDVCKNCGEYVILPVFVHAV